MALGFLQSPSERMSAIFFSFCSNARIFNTAVIHQAVRHSPVESKMAATTFNFGRILLQPSVVFFQSKLSFAFVNRKPVLPGHVLVSPVRVVKRFCDLTEEEVADLFLSTQKVARVLEKAYSANSLSIAIQDGPDAGQTVEHVHVHVLPRKKGDFKRNDDVYKALAEHDKQQTEEAGSNSRGFRSEEDMAREATYLAELF